MGLRPQTLVICDSRSAVIPTDVDRIDDVQQNVSLYAKCLLSLSFCRFSLYQINNLDKKAVLSQENRAMPQLFFSV